jgi:hypothetical protein
VKPTEPVMRGLRSRGVAIARGCLDGTISFETSNCALTASFTPSLNYERPGAEKPNVGDLVSGLTGLVVIGLYYGVLPGGERINWRTGRMRSPAMNKLVGGAMTAGCLVFVAVGLVQLLNT